MTTETLKIVMIALGSTTAVIVMSFVVVWLLIEFVNFSREWFPVEADDDDLS